MAYTLAEIEAEQARRAQGGQRTQTPGYGEGPSIRAAQELPMGKMASMGVGARSALERLAYGLAQPFVEQEGFPEDIQKKFHERAQAIEPRYQRSYAQNPWSTMGGEALADIGVTYPLTKGAGGIAGKAVPKLGAAGTKMGQYGGDVASLALASGLLGGAQYTNPNESRAENALTGAGIGGGIAAGVPIIGKALGVTGQGFKGGYDLIRREIGSQPHIMEHILKDYTPEEIRLALQNYGKGREHGLSLTPAEASHSGIAAKKQASFGKSPEGERQMYEHVKGNQTKQEELVNSLMNVINPNSAHAAEELRTVAQKVIGKKEKALIERARPHYEKAFEPDVSPNAFNKIVEDTNVQKAYSDVMEDTVYEQIRKQFPANSIAVLDLVKKNMDDSISSELRSGNKNKARLITESKNQLLKKMEEISPDYKKARSIYSEESPLIDLLRKREVGQIATLSDKNIKKVGNIIFDPAQTDPTVLARMRNEFIKENPEVWSRIIRNQMESKIATAAVGKTGYHGANFYNQILANDKTYKQYMNALEGKPKAQKMLTEMKDLFKDLIDQPTVKGATAQAKTSMSAPRSSSEAVATFARNAIGGKYDKAAVELITSDQWVKYFDDALRLKGAQKQNALLKLLNKVEEKTGPQIGRKALAATLTGYKTKTAGEPEPY